MTVRFFLLRAGRKYETAALPRRPSARRRLMIAYAFLLGAVEVRVVRDACFLGSFYEGGGDLQRADRIGHGQRSVGAVVAIGEATV